MPVSQARSDGVLSATTHTMVRSPLPSSPFEFNFPNRTIRIRAFAAQLCSNSTEQARLRLQLPSRSRSGKTCCLPVTNGRVDVRSCQGDHTMLRKLAVLLLCHSLSQAIWGQPNPTASHELRPDWNGKGWNRRSNDNPRSPARTCDARYIAASTDSLEKCWCIGPSVERHIGSDQKSKQATRRGEPERINQLTSGA
jgi:hypothetical protein